MCWPKNEQLEKRFLVDASKLRNIYWFIRSSRFEKDRRRHYRQAAKEKGRLAALGYDQELIRLYRLVLKNPHCERREKRFHEHLHAPEQMTLF